jgi:hypothetical protein
MVSTVDTLAVQFFRQNGLFEVELGSRSMPTGCSGLLARDARSPT